MARDEKMIAALQRERTAYVARGDTDRVRQVDEQLKHYGYDADAAGAEQVPQGRTAPTGQTAASAGEQDKTSTGKAKKGP